MILLHRRLAIQGLGDAGSQPLHSHDNSVVIVFNGEIYSVNDLRGWVPDYPFQGTSDTEVLVALYLKYGRDMLQFLRGMYAFAIWDNRQNALFLARDPYGIKPLYLAETPDGIWFSSQVKSLKGLSGVDYSAEPAGHAGFFLWGSVPEPYTLYRGIRALRSGHSLWLERGAASVEVPFASITHSLLHGPAVRGDESASLRLKRALSDSVRAHFVSDVPVALFLSAGLDSSTILGTAADAFQPQGLTALTLGFDVHVGTAEDETAEATQIARYYGTRQQTDIVGRSTFEGEADRFLHQMDQPTIDGINTYFVAKMAREAGFKVALSGLGGDELFGGYSSFTEIPRMMNVNHALGVSRRFGGIIRRWTEPVIKRYTSPKYAGILEYGDTLEGAYLLRRGLFMPWELPEVLDPDLAADGLDTLRQKTFEGQDRNAMESLPLHAQICVMESTRYMRNQLLRDADWAGMAHSVEIRTPLVDQFLLTQTSPLIRSRRPPNKLSLARTLTKPLPDNIFHRGKTGFGVPVREWLAAAMPEKPERGLRSWAKFIYHRQWVQDC